MKLPAPIAIALQTAFTRYVELDPDSNSRLLKLRGKVVCFQVEGVDLPIWFIFNEVGMNETSVARFLYWHLPPAGARSSTVT